mmetsp:Transcript_2762/g.6599  ORF Transcript_2762/g.6599 Transcript_2762/m.6599 type:complete len:718 (-) Transcript_2762:951-3104(-)
MTSSKVSVAYRRQRKVMLAAAAILLVTSSTVESLVAPFSPSQHQRSQLLSPVHSSASHGTCSVVFSNSVGSSPASARASAAARTVLLATSLGKSKISFAEADEDDLKEKKNGDDGDDSQTDLPLTVSKFRQLKDVMWIREALEDWTAAEFALSVERSEGKGSYGGASSATAQSSSSRKTKKRAVDYEKLLSQITKRIEDIICEPFEDEASLLDDNGVLKLDENVGMGRYAYTNEDRKMLMEKILKTRENLSTVLESNDFEGSDSNEEKESFIKQVKVPDISSLVTKSNETKAVGEKNSTSAASGPQLYVRDDGTVDWEGALQDRAALRKFGGAVWARINGQTPDDLGEEDDDETTSKDGGGEVGGAAHHSKPAVTAKIEDTPAIQSARRKLNLLQDKLKEKERAHTTLVQSGLKAGQAVANVKLASLDPSLRSKIRLSAEALLILEQQVSYQNLVYELERIYTYLVTELQNPTTKGYIPLQDRLNVAEYGLLESQIQSCSRELNSKGVLDADILAVIAEQMTDFKRRLGIDYYVTGLTYDREAIIRWLNDLYLTSKTGIMFYVKGTQLFWSDVVFSVSLIGRAAQGVTLKPREVRTIRRTFKDVITFIPVVIILIIPLSPVGHVLVFGAIQRFFPGFFPSCFTEQRQNLLQLYETTEFSEVTIKENLQERLKRFLEALTFSIVTKTQDFYRQLTNTYSEETDTTDIANGTNRTVEEK